MKKYLRIFIFTFWILSLFACISISAEAAKTEVNFNEGISLLYKNEHYLLDENNKKTLDIAKWTKIDILKIDQTPDKAIAQVSWSRWDVANVSLAEIDANKSLWGEEKKFVSTINSSNPLSRFQLVFNEKDASMTDLEPDVLLGKYTAFFSNELGYYNTAVTNWSKGNEILENSVRPAITDQKDRILEGYLFGDAKIKLNGTHPDIDDALYTIKLRLKLYLVYGQESNILLSYNINFTIHETFYNQADKIQRKIIFWNIRRPSELTEDYPLAEIFDVPGYNSVIIGLISVITLIPLMLYLRKRLSIKDMITKGGI